MGIWHGLRKALQNKWYLTGIGITLVFSCDLYHRKKAMVCRMIPETIPEWLQHGIYLMLLAAPVIYLFLIGQTGQKIMTNALKISDSRERMVNFRNMPVAAKRVKDTAFFSSLRFRCRSGAPPGTAGDCFGLQYHKN